MNPVPGEVYLQRAQQRVCRIILRRDDPYVVCLDVYRDGFRRLCRPHRTELRKWLRGAEVC